MSANTMFPYSYLETMTLCELQDKCERLISRIPDAETRENLGWYLEGFHSDIPSLIELAVEIMAGTYS